MLSRFSFLAYNLTLRVSLEDFVDAVERIGCEVTHIIFLTHPLDLNCFSPLCTCCDEINHCIHDVVVVYCHHYILERCEKDQNCKLQFPQPDYQPCHSPEFRTVFGIMIGPFSSYEIGKT